MLILNVAQREIKALSPEDEQTSGLVMVPARFVGTRLHSCSGLIATTQLISKT